MSFYLSPRVYEISIYDTFMELHYQECLTIEMNPYGYTGMSNKISNDIPKNIKSSFILL